MAHAQVPGPLAAEIYLPSAISPTLKIYFHNLRRGPFTSECACADWTSGYEI